MHELPRLAVEGLTKHFGGLRAVDDLSLTVWPGEIISVIGPNGAGKTTLFNLITGLERPDSGQIYLDGQSITGQSPDRIAEAGIARTFQQIRVFANMTVLDNVLVGAHRRLHYVRAEGFISPSRRRRPGLNLLALLAETLLALLRPPPVRAEAAALQADAQQILAIFGERLLPRQTHYAYSLSYANRRRTEIARALALRPALLLLDEPTAGMNPAETAELTELIGHLQTLGMTMLLIEHKLDLVNRLSNRVIVMDYGRKIAEGTPAEVRRNEAVITAYLGRQAAATEPTDG